MLLLAVALLVLAGCSANDDDRYRPSIRDLNADPIAYSERSIVVRGFLEQREIFLALFTDESFAQGRELTNADTVFVSLTSFAAEAGTSIDECIDRYVEVSGVFDLFDDLDFYGMNVVHSVKGYSDQNYSGDGAVCHESK